MKKTLKFLFRATMIGGMITGVSGSVAFGQLYTGWSSYQDFIMNPGATGITTNQVNFPVLIRLTSANSVIFDAASFPNTPADLRFAKGGNLNAGYPYQVERWDATHQLAEIWVLVDTVFYGVTSQSIRMYWGNDTASAGSSGPAVFTNGFTNVWHLQDTTDALGKMPLTGSVKPVQGAAGVIGLADTFNGTTQYLITADSTSSNATALNFTNGGPFTLSAWAYATTTNAEHAILDKGNYMWELKEMDATPHWGGLQYVSTTGWAWCQSASAISTNAWHHIVFVRTNAGTSPNYADSIYIDGVLSSGTVTLSSGTTAAATTHPVAIGNRPEAGTATTYLWRGKIEEAEVANVGRSHDWIKLCFANQNASQTFIQPSPTPSAPTLSTPSNGAVNQPVSLTLAWGAVYTATGYEVQVSATSAFSTTVYDQPGITGTAQAITGLANSVTYYWRANATNSAGTGSWSGAWSFSTIAPWSAPLLTSPTNGAVNQPILPVLVWGGVSGAASYTLQVSTSSAFSAMVFSQGGLTAPSQAVGPLSYLATYFWRVNAYDGTSVTSLWSSAWSFVTTMPVPGAPALASPTNGAVNQPVAIFLSWSTVSTASSYQAQVSTDAVFGTTVFGQSGLTAPFISAGALANSTTYYWRAGASNAGGSGGWSGAWSFATIVATAGTPSLSSPASGAQNQAASLTLNWGTASAATSYALQISTASTFATTFLSQSVSVTSASVTNLALGTTYYWQVAGVNVAGQGLWSTAWSFTTVTTAVSRQGDQGTLKTDFGVRGDALVYSLASAGVVEITFSDLLGRASMVLKRTQSAGRYAIELKHCNCAAGRYIVHFKAAGVEKRAFVMITR